MVTSSQNFRMAIMGASSLLGREIVRIAQERELGLSELKLYAHPNQSGERLEYCDEEIKIEPISESWSDGMDLAVHVASDDEECRYLDTQIPKADCVLIGSTANYRENPDFPLVIPELNADTLLQTGSLDIIVNPCPASIQLAMLLGPLGKAGQINKALLTNLRPVSEYGQAGIKELERQCLSVFNLRNIDHFVFPAQIAFNCLSGLHHPAAGPADSIASQTKRLLARPDLDVIVTNVLVPVFFGQSQIVHIEIDQPTDEARLRQILRNANGIEISELKDSDHHPAPLDAVSGDQLLLGRINVPAHDPRRIIMWSVMDNLRKGSALNIVQIAERLFDLWSRKPN